MLHLFIVADRFAIEGRGVVLVPGIPGPNALGGKTVKQGASIRLITPEGGEIDTVVRAFEMISYRPGKKPNEAVPILLPTEINKDAVPIGTEVMLIEDSDAS